METDINKKPVLAGMLNGIFSTGVGSVTMTVFGLIGFILTSRWLTKDELGAFVILQLIAGFIVGVSSLGVELSLTKFLAESKDAQQQQEIINTVVSFRMLMILLFSGAALLLQDTLFGLFGQTVYTSIITYIPLLVFFESIFRLIDSVFGGVFDFKWIGISTVVLSIVNLALIIVLVGWQDLGLVGRIWARLGGLILSILLAVIMTKIKVKFRINFRLLRDILKFSFPLFLNYILSFIFMRADTFIIGGFLGPAEIAIYEIARKIPESLESLYDAFRKVYFPYLSDLFSQKDHEGAAKVLNHSLRLISVAGVFGVLVAFLFGGEIILLLFTETYEQSILLFGFLMIILLFNVIDYTLGYSLVAVGESNKPPLINVLHTAMNFLGYFLLIPVIGIFGVASANIAGLVTVNPVNVFFLRRKQVKARVRNYVIPLLLGILVLVLFFAFDVHSWYIRAGLIVGYILLCFITGFISTNDIQQVLHQYKIFSSRNKQTKESAEQAVISKAKSERCMEIVYVAGVFPYPPNSGHRIRNYNLIKRLGTKHHLHLRLLVDAEPTEEELQGLAPYVTSLRYYVQPAYKALSRPFEALSYWLRGIPPELRFFYDRRMMNDLVNLFEKQKIDLLQIEDPAMAMYVNAVPVDANVKKVLTFHDINFRKYERIAHLETSKKRKLRLKFHSRMMKKWEPEIAGRFDLCVTMSENDQELLREMNPGIHAIVVSNGVDTEEFDVLEENRSRLMYHLLFVGNMDYRPNIDAVTYFVKKVMPLLDQTLPNYVFWIVGINPRDEVLALKNEKIQVTGRVPDVKPYYENAQVVVVPLFAGGGTRLKILEALALGRPVVSTTIGAEGLDLTAGEHFFLADTPETFCDAIKILIKDPAFRQRMESQGRQRVVERYDWTPIMEMLEREYLALVGK